MTQPPNQVEQSRGPATVAVPRSILTMTLTTVVVMIGVIVYTANSDTPVGLVMRDANQVTQARAWTGLVSTLGNGLWAVSIGALLVTVGLVSTGPVRRSVLALLGLTIVLFFDDALLLHDEILPDWGIPEILIIVAYAAAGSTATVVSLPVLRRSGTLTSFVAALVLFAVSVGVDLLDPRQWWGPDVLFAVEDGAKFIGIGLWTDTMIRLGRRHLVQRRPA